jgi:hypothetical protein
LEWSDGSRIEPGPGTRLRAGGDGRIDLLDGRIVAEVEPRRDPFAIHAGGILVEVLGTRFAVEAGASTAAVQVERGRVAVAGGGGRLELGPGGVAWLGSGRLAAGPTAAWSVRPDAGWTGEPVAEGMATVVKPEDSLRFGGTVRWIASPEAAAGHATLDTAGTLVLELGAAEAVTVSVTMVLAPAAAPAAWRGNLQRELRVPAGGGVFRLPVAGFAPIAGEAPAGRFATVLRRLTLTIGGGPAGLVLRRAALEPGRL